MTGGQAPQREGPGAHTQGQCLKQVSAPGVQSEQQLPSHKPNITRQPDGSLETDQANANSAVMVSIRNSPVMMSQSPMMQSLGMNES
jgi:hypothetical protein